MKKIGLIGIAALMCVSCVGEKEMAKQSQQEEIMPAGAVEVPVATQPVNAVEVPVAAQPVISDPDYYRRNIVVKAMGDDYVVYEYTDVGIDKVANLASYYCYQTNPGKSAYLRDIYMTKNYHRRATFDCVDLATK